MILEFTIAGRPKAWERAVDIPDPRRPGRRIKINPKEMRSWQKMCAQLAMLKMRGQALMTGPLKFELLAVYRIPPSWPAAKREAALDGKVWKTSKPDIDNLVKIVCDALNGVAYADDAQVVQMSVGKRYGSPERMDVRLSRLDFLDDHAAPGAFREAAAIRAGQAPLPLDPAKASNAQIGGRRG